METRVQITVSEKVDSRLARGFLLDRARVQSSKKASCSTLVISAGLTSNKRRRLGSRVGCKHYGFENRANLLK